MSNLLKYSDEITLQNLEGSSPNYLASCGIDRICPSNHGVYTFTDNPGDYIRMDHKKGKWRILDSRGNTSTKTL